MFKTCPFRDSPKRLLSSHDFNYAYLHVHLFTYLHPHILPSFHFLTSSYTPCFFGYLGSILSEDPLPYWFVIFTLEGYYGVLSQVLKQVCLIHLFLHYHMFTYLHIYRSSLYHENSFLLYRLFWICYIFLTGSYGERYGPLLTSHEFDYS